jgi:Cytochrome P450
MVGKRREGVQVLTKQGNQISLRFLLQPLLKSQAQRCHVEGHQEADLMAVRGSFQVRAQCLTHGWLCFHQRIEIDGSVRRCLHRDLIADQKTGPLLIFAGHETTSNLIGTSTLMLLDHPNQLEQLKADLSLVPAAVEELLRFSGPAAIAGPRFATEDIEIAGQQIKQGDILIPYLLSANHDESQFTQPDELDLARTISRHLAFGHGIHTCLGAPLARLEGDIAFTTLLRRMPNLRLSVPRENITWHFSLNSRSLTALPVAF